MKHVRKNSVRAAAGVLVFAACAIFAGCVTSSHVRGIEPSVRPLQRTAYVVLGEAEARSSNFTLLWFFTVTPLPDIDRAVSVAVTAKGGDELIDVRWWLERQYWILGTVNVVHIKGKVIRYTGVSR